MFRKNPAIISRDEEAGKHLVFNPDNSLPLVMNDSSYAIWELCDGTRDSQAIIRELQNKYEFDAAAVSDEELHRIVARHLTIFQHTELIIDAEPGSAGATYATS